MKYLCVILGLAAFYLSACANDTSRSATDGTATMPLGDQPVAHGGINQVLVVADSSLWAGPVGDSFFYYFNMPYLLLPAPEPIFDLIHMTPEGLARQPLKKEFRTIVFLADMNDENSSTAQMLKADLGPEKMAEVQRANDCNITVGQDKWALSQLLFYLNGYGNNKLQECIASSFPSIAARINEREQQTIKATLFEGGDDTKLQEDIAAKFKLQIKIPKGFRQARYDEKDTTLWLRKDDRGITFNILLHKLPYLDKSQLSKAGFKKIRDEASRIVATQQPGPYMRINDGDLPLFVENTTISNAQAVQAKGIWDTGEGTQNSPFISNLVLNTKTNELVLVDGFIIAPPGKEKRNYMQEMEVLVSSVRF